MPDRYRFVAWLVADWNWARLTLPCAVVWLLLLPVVWAAERASLLLLSTLLPVYLIHQYEEHAEGRFVAFVDAELGGGRPVLTPLAAFWINALGVWLLFLVAFYLARYLALVFALVPIYAMLVNGLTHVAAGLALRRSNPGLVTSLVLFLPWGGFLLVWINGRTGAVLADNAVALLIALLLHAVIVAYAVRRRRRLLVAGGQPVR